ncbi:698_t:CDS:2 [Rhizophagus irregularis]|nr:698_t:CDS:2 [Rhizophagus irregularis]
MTLSHDISEEKELYAIVSGKWNEMKKRLTPLKDKKKNMNLIIGLMGFEFDRANSKIPRINQSLPLLSSRYSQIQTSEKEINAFNCCLSILIKQRGNVYSQLYTGKQHAETCLKHVCLRIVQETASKHLNAGLCCLTTVGVINASWKTACWNVPTVP